MLVITAERIENGRVRVILQQGDIVKCCDGCPGQFKGFILDVADGDTIRQVVFYLQNQYDIIGDIGYLLSDNRTVDYGDELSLAEVAELNIKESK